MYYLILWNQVDILQKHFKKDHVHMRLWTRLYGMFFFQIPLYIPDIYPIDFMHITLIFKILINFFIFACRLFFHQAGMCTITFCNYNYNYNYIGFRFSITVTLPSMSITITTFVNYNCFLFLAHNEHRLYFFKRICRRRQY